MSARCRLALWQLVLFSYLLLTGCGNEAGEQSTSTFAIATGGTGGLYYPIGGAMASVWSNELDGINAKAEVTGGSFINVIQVARKESEFGFAMADVLTDAYSGSGRFPEPLPLRILLNTYPNIMHIVTVRDSGITSINDLRGQRVSMGPANSGTANTAENTLATLGIGLDEFAPTYLNFAETTSAIKDGTIAAGFIIGGIGISAVTELAVTRDMHLVSLSDDEIATLLNAYPAYSGYEVAADTYNGVGKTTLALSIWSSIVVHESLADQTAYKLVCTLFQHNAALTRVSPAAAAITGDNLDQVSSVPLHRGSRRYFKDYGKNGGDPFAVTCVE